MKKIMSLFLSLILVASLSVTAFAVELKSFDDVDPTRWSHSAIMLCVEKGAISGTRTPDANGVGSFNPTGKVTLGQFLAVITRLVCPEAIKDTEGHWALKNYNAAVESGIIKFTDFNSTADALNSTLAREDMAFILVGAAKVNGEELKAIDGIESIITDYNSISGSRKDAVLKCYSNGLIAGYSDGSFGYADTMTREQMATVVCRLMEYQPRAEVKFEEEKAPVVQSSEYFVQSGTNKGMVKPEYQVEVAKQVLENVQLYQNDKGELCVKVNAFSMPQELINAGWEINLKVTPFYKSNSDMFMSTKCDLGDVGEGSAVSSFVYTGGGRRDNYEKTPVKVSEVGRVTLSISVSHKDYSKNDLLLNFYSSSDSKAKVVGNYENRDSLGSEVINMNVSSIYSGIGK